MQPGAGACAGRQLKFRPNPAKQLLQLRPTFTRLCLPAGTRHQRRRGRQLCRAGPQAPVTLTSSRSATSQAAAPSSPWPRSHQQQSDATSTSGSGRTSSSSQSTSSGEFSRAPTAVEQQQQQQWQDEEQAASRGATHDDLFSARATYFVNSAALVCILPYLNLYFRGLGFSPEQIGALSALRPWVYAAAGPLLAGLADKAQAHRVVLLAAFVGSTLTRTAMGYTPGFEAQLALATLTESLTAPVAVITDSAVMCAVDEEGDYGKQRAWAAMGWGVFSIVAGAAISRYGLDAGFIGCLLLSCAALIPTSMLPVKALALPQPASGAAGMATIKDQRTLFSVASSMDEDGAASSSGTDSDDDSGQLPGSWSRRWAASWRTGFAAISSQDEDDAGPELGAEQQSKPGLGVSALAPCTTAPNTPPVTSNVVPASTFHRSSSGSSAASAEADQSSRPLSHEAASSSRSSRADAVAQGGYPGSNPISNAAASPTAPVTSSAMMRATFQRSAAAQGLATRSLLRTGDWDIECDRILPLPLSRVGAVPPLERESLGGGDGPPVGFWQGLATLVEDPEVVIFFAIATLLGFASGTIGSYLFMYLDELGASRTLMGASILVGSASEAPFFFFAGAILRKLGVKTAMNVAVLAYVVRLLLYSELGDIGNPWAVLPMEALHGVGFGVAWAAGTVHCARIAAPGLKSTTQAIFTALYLGVGNGLGALAGGFTYASAGPSAVFQDAAGVVFGGWLLCTAASGVVARRQS